MSIRLNTIWKLTIPLSAASIYPDSLLNTTLDLFWVFFTEYLRWTWTRQFWRAAWCSWASSSPSPSSLSSSGSRSSMSQGSFLPFYLNMGSWDRKTPPRISKERCRVPIDKAIAHRPSFTKNIVDTNIPVVFHEPLSQVHPPGQRSPCKLSELAHLWTPFHRQCDVLEATIITDGSFRQREYQTWSRFDANPLLEHQVLSGPDHGVLLALPQPHHWVHQVSLWGR